MTKKNAKTSKPATKSNTKSVEVAGAVRGKTSRAAMINLLLKNKGKVVSIQSLKEAVAKTTGLQPETVESRVKTRVKMVAEYAKAHDLKLNVTSKGMQLTPVKG